jgi:hypothetical protein
MLKDINYKTILSELEKEDENNFDNESIFAAKEYIKNTKQDNINWNNYIIA